MLENYPKKKEKKKRVATKFQNPCCLLSFKMFKTRLLISVFFFSCSFADKIFMNDVQRQNKDAVIENNCTQK